MADPVLLAQAETELRQVLAEYAQAVHRRELLAVVRRLRTGLEQALRARVAPDMGDADFLTLSEAVIPTYLWRLQAFEPVYARLERQPRAVTLFELRATTAGLANVIVNVWPRLFETAPPPLIHPTSAAADSLGSAPSASAPATAARWLDWEDLTLWVVLSLVLPWLLGLTVRWWAIPLVPRVLPLLLAVIGLALVYLWWRHLWNLITHVGLIRLLLGLLLIAALLAVGWGLFEAARPAEGTIGTRFGYGMRALPAAVARGTERLFTAGVHTGDRVLALLLATPAAETPPRPTPTAPIAAVVAGFAIGDDVVVHTTGATLRCRAGPGLNYPVITQLADGTRLTLIAGPHEADGLRWWQVERNGVRCWSAERFLTPAR
jgi:energy-converting hydrogenase Eha subunit E